MNETAQNVTAMNGSIDGWQVEWKWGCAIQTMMRSPLIVSMKIPVETFAGDLVEVRRVVWYSSFTQ
jgi:hypothetical protein